MKIKSVYNAPWFIKVVFVVSLFIVLFSAGLGYKHIIDVYNSQKLVIQTYKVNIELEQVLSYLKDAETGQRSFFITQDSLYLEPLLKSRVKINNTITELKRLTKDSPNQKENIEELETLAYDRIYGLEISKNYNIKDNVQLSEIKKAFSQSKVYMNSIRKKLKTMIALEEQMLQERLETHNTNIKHTPFFLFTLIVFTLLMIFLAYLKINKDLENLKETNRQLEVFRELTNQSEIINKHGSWRWNIEEDYFYFSDNLFRLLGEAPNSFEHTVANFMKFVHPDDVGKLSEQTSKMMKEKDLPFITYRVVHKDGTIKYLKAYGKSIEDPEGKSQLLGTTTDITDEIDHFNTLEKRNQELVANNEELEAFNYVASHDLQEPLRKIQTFLSRLEDSEYDNFSDKGKVYTERINKAATRMRNLINDLLQYSRTNKTNEVTSLCDINVLIENAQQEMSELIVSENAIITVAKFPEMKVVPFQIEQLFTNLINNSLKYKSLERSPVINIGYHNVTQEDHTILKNSLHTNFNKITFRDNGIGFKQEYASKIFELFSRLHTREEYSGTGIGLSICKKIIDNHNGYILANSAINNGAEFIIYLPISS